MCTTGRYLPEVTLVIVTVVYITAGWARRTRRKSRIREKRMITSSHLSRRRVILGAGSLGAAGLLVAGAGSALAETTLERARQQGFIRAGFANEAPFGYATTDGKLTGEAPQVAKAVL